MAKKNNGDGSASAPAPSTVDEAWDEELRAMEELYETAKALKVCVGAVGGSRRRVRFRAAEAATKMREAVAEALGAEHRAFDNWARLADQPSLFSEDEFPPRTPPPVTPITTRRTN